MDADPIQVLAAHLDAELPIEFFYANPYPTDDAVLCPTYQAEPARERCEGCAHVDEAHFCPLAFWSLRKVIEWHDYDEARSRQAELVPYRFAIQAKDPLRALDKLGRVQQALIGVSELANQFDVHAVTTLMQDVGKTGLTPVLVEDWTDWRAKIAAHEAPLLVLLPHTLRDARHNQECLEIAGKQRVTDEISKKDVSNGREPGPIVLLIGCNTANRGASFRRPAVRFMTAGAALVVTSMMQVLGRHALPMASDLITQIADSQTEAVQKNGGYTTFGEIMRHVRRAWLRKDQPPISLGLKCYGDARWRF